MSDDVWERIDLEGIARWFETHLYQSCDTTPPQLTEEYNDLIPHDVEITVKEIKNTLNALPRQKTCAGDNLVGEMLTALAEDEELCEALAGLLTMHFQNPVERTELGEWDHVEVPLIPKRPNASAPDEFRGISRLPVMKKLTLKYMQLTLKDIDASLPPNPRTFGF